VSAATLLGSTVPLDGATGVPTSIGSLGSGTLAQLNAALTDANLDPNVTPITLIAAAAYTLQLADLSSVLIFTHATPVVTVPDTLTKGRAVILVGSVAAVQIIPDGASALTLNVGPSATIPVQTLEAWAPAAVMMIDDTAGAEFAWVYGSLG